MKNLTTKFIGVFIISLMTLAASYAEEIDYRSPRVHFYVPIYDLMTPVGYDFHQPGRSKGTHLAVMIERSDGYFVWQTLNWGSILYGYADGVHGKKLNREQIIRQLNSKLSQITHPGLDTDPFNGFYELALLENGKINCGNNFTGYNFDSELGINAITKESIGLMFCTISGDVDIPLWITNDMKCALFCSTGEVQFTDYNCVPFVKYDIEYAFPPKPMDFAGVCLSSELRKTVSGLSARGFTELKDDSIDEVWDEFNYEMGGMLGASKNQVLMTGEVFEQSCIITLNANDNGNVYSIGGDMDLRYDKLEDAMKEIQRIRYRSESYHKKTGHPDLNPYNSDLPAGFIIYFDDGYVNYHVYETENGKYLIKFLFAQNL